MKSKTSQISCLRDVIWFGISSSPLGLVLAARTERGVCSVMLGDDYEKLREELNRRFPGKELAENDYEAELLAREIADSFNDPGHIVDRAVDLMGTDFQKKVWEELLRIPRGQTTTYAEIARRIGSPKAVRAVGTACGANHIAVIVPCHRVLNSGGGLSGYRWGVERKVALLELEKPSVN